MDTITNSIERRRLSNRQFEHYFKSDDRLRGFFVKNLENVQGDERDVLIFSVGYGKDAQGRMSTNFGPLNKEGGERRLNVQVTRAKDKVIVVSSIRAQDIDIRSTKSSGVLAFHRYLDYAENGSKSLQHIAYQSGREPDSPLEEDVISVIRGMGYECIPQVGCSSYRIDIGIIDPSKPGRFLLGVECDGATYHSAYSARDRDRLRQFILEDFGWRIHRIWSPEWVSRRSTEIEKLQKAIEMASKIPSIDNINDISSNEVSDELDDEFEDGIEIDYDLEDSSLEGVIPGCIQYENAIIPYTYWEHSTLAHPDNYFNIRHLMKNIVDDEGPIHIDHATRIIAENHGTKRIGSKIRETIEYLSQCCEEDGDIAINGNFLWPLDIENPPVRIPSPMDENSCRPLEWICDEEIDTALYLIVNHCKAISSEALITTCARMYGFQRMGENIEYRLQDRINDLIARRQLVERGSSIILR